MFIETDVPICGYYYLVETCIMFVSHGNDFFAPIMVIAKLQELTCQG